jgi:hypothetical protein
MAMPIAAMTVTVFPEIGSGEPILWIDSQAIAPDGQQKEHCVEQCRQDRRCL